jgi:hypothetical protein
VGKTLEKPAKMKEIFSELQNGAEFHGPVSVAFRQTL